MDRERLGRRIKAYRKLKGYTQVRLAKELDIPVMNLGDVERGEQPAADELLDQIAVQLRIPKQELKGEPLREKEEE
ncbi:Helix-turn-helix [Lentibacillus halodurans]|uniref:Helix-turn-helix n=1 Tax=Lentibacillus halodurans TaxID=237679 RepID=A0A1I1A1X8_9BACI|nr:helix-turn-helix transcriptional regulator [Lentibacillus halodurans]SFB31994.1 Helix-turn-helix [Lentibacillus halodurans]